MVNLRQTIPFVLTLFTLLEVSTANLNQDKDQNCLFIYREYKPDDYFRSFIYFTATSQLPDTADGLITWNIISHTFPQNHASLLILNKPHLGDNCLIIFLLLTDTTPKPNLRIDQQTIFSHYYKSSYGVFLICLHPHVSIPSWGNSPASVYLSFSTSTKMVDSFLSKDGGGGYEYFPIPPHVQTWDIFQRKWRPSMTWVPVKWTMFAVNDFNHACIPRSVWSRMKYSFPNTVEEYTYPYDDKQELFFPS
ncbi:hypothetical protein Fcan01_23767 [Folsomia candida]|uniref:Uncharacterized protein n=1 Tax=Folsomia candida TaxID=158441 RepID=A0A226D8Q3_FOLCA|nr:hypothetical protein Fcan01_23767 [Folsomia candida]